MESLFGITEGHLDQNILALLETDAFYSDIVDTQDPIALTKLLMRVCCKERGNCYAIDTLIVSMLDLLSCAQKAATTIDFVALIKLKNNILQTQFGMDWTPSVLKTAVITMHPDTTWSGDTYAECSTEDQATINRHTKNRILAHIGVHGTIAKSNGISLNDHLHKNATINNNVATSYPSDLPALTDRIISYADSSTEKSNHPSTRELRRQDGDKDKDKDQDTRDQSKNNEREGTQFALTEGESPSDETNQTAAQLLMSGYGNHDDSNLYESPHFIQVGEVWEDDSTNVSENHDPDDC